MVLSANVIDSFCEIKYAANGVTVCTGNITNVDDGRIYLRQRRTKPTNQELSQISKQTGCIVK